MTYSSAIAANSRPVTAETSVKKTEKEQTNAVKKEEKTAELTAQEQLNARVVQSALEVSIKAGDKSQALLYRSAVEAINVELEPSLGPNAIQNAMGQDNSPEGTADRIVSLTTAFFGAYAAQNPDKDPETLVKDFVGVIRGGFEKGFNEASQILQGLGVLNGNVAEGINKTYELVQKGYDDFLSNAMSAIQQQREANATPAAE